MVVFYGEQIAMLPALAYNDAPWNACSLFRRMPFYILTFYMGLHCFVGCYWRVQAMLMNCWEGFGEKVLSGYWWSELYLFVQWAPMWGTLVFGKWVCVIGWQTAPLKSGTSLQHQCQCRFEQILVWWIVVYFRHLHEDIFSSDVCVLLLLDEIMPWKTGTLLQRNWKSD
jgi:hypothetical protein